jgi:phosphatidylserine/phosphatidylglycerophosphate/cardiolipin synthase-like enzyme
VEARIRAAEERARAAERLAEEAVQRARDASERARRLEGQCAELEARAAEADARAKAAEARAAAAIERSAASALPELPAAADGADGGSAPAPLAEVSFSPGNDCLQTICGQLSRVRRSIDICVFTITDDRIAHAILEAHRRGVKVRVITDNDKSLDEGSDVDRLARAGVPVRKDISEYHMHHKFAVFDGRRMLTGSYNWTRGAARYNEENLIVSGDPRLVEPFTREFEALWRKLGPA